MPRHSVIVDLPPRPIAHADAKFHVKSNGSKLGTLAISKGAIVWYPFNSPYGCKLSWEQFDGLMTDAATRFEVRK
jgi:hypothetical protein